MLAVMRACTRCGEIKPLDQFPPVRRGEPRLQTWCRDCFASYGAEYYRKNHHVQKRRLLRNALARRAGNHKRMLEYLAAHPCVDCGEADVVVLQFDHLHNKRFDLAQMLSGGWTWRAIEQEIAKCEVRCSNCHRLRTARRHAERKPRLPRGIPLPEQLRLGDAQTRVCRLCGREQPLTSFPFRSKKDGIRHRTCLSCQRDLARAWYVRRFPEAKRIVGYGAHLREVNAAKVEEFLRGHPCVDCGEANTLLLDFDHLRDKVDDVANLVRSGRSWIELAEEIAKCEVRCANCHMRKTAREVGSYRLGFVSDRKGLEPLALVLAQAATPERIELSPAVP
jgi:hypothetical protein